MIPKTIHYVWLGGSEISPETKEFIKTWKKNMPDYIIKRWDEDSFDCNSIPWVKQAIEHKMWAFAADYIRLYALYNEGGIYLDTDVAVLRPFDEFLNYSFFSATEVHPQFENEGKIKLNNDFLPQTPNEPIPYFGILSAIMGSEKGNPLICHCLNYYKDRNFINQDGTMSVKIIIPDIIGMQAIRYGFRYVDKTQFLDLNMVIFDSSVFVGSIRNLNNNSFAIHYCEGSWRIHWWPRRKKLLYYIETKIKHFLGIQRKFNEHL